MASIDVLTTRFYSYDKMYSHDLREHSFVDWPFREECNCTPEKMAKAGFVHCPSENEPDVACCFFCLIELEGWEPDDDPWSEHVKRSPNCGFLTMKKDFTELTVAEFCHLEKERLKVYIKKVCHKKMAYMREAVDHTLELSISPLQFPQLSDLPKRGAQQQYSPSPLLPALEKIIGGLAEEGEGGLSENSIQSTFHFFTIV